MKRQDAIWCKRILDVIGALGLIIISAPLWVIVSLLIKLEDSGPVFYYRRVMGKNGGQFDALKFRTMVVDAEAILERNGELQRRFEKNFKLENDPRITRIGRILRKTSIDEFPQLINVLRGEMSLVGPRMISPPELAKYGEYGEKLLSVKPGCAGPWVAAGRQNLPYAKRILLDMEYIDNWAILLDMQIICKTAIAVIRMRGAL
jgi:lipopolysaccharide/colanic/teichoic acid biosynthesis glycosyltransferase